MNVFHIHFEFRGILEAVWNGINSQMPFYVNNQTSMGAFQRLERCLIYELFISINEWVWNISPPKNLRWLGWFLSPHCLSLSANSWSCYWKNRTYTLTVILGQWNKKKKNSQLLWIVWTIYQTNTPTLCFLSKSFCSFVARMLDVSICIIEYNQSFLWDIFCVTAFDIQ